MTTEERVGEGQGAAGRGGLRSRQSAEGDDRSTTDNTAKKQAEGVALMWKQNLGVDAKVNAQEFQAWMDSFYAGKLGGR